MKKKKIIIVILAIILICGLIFGILIARCNEDKPNLSNGINGETTATPIVEQEPVDDLIEDITPTAEPTEVIEPTVTQEPEGTVIPEPTVTPEPTATPEPTSTVVPTATPELSATPTVAPTVTPAPAPTEEPKKVTVDLSIELGEWVDFEDAGVVIRGYQCKVSWDIDNVGDKSVDADFMRIMGINETPIVYSLTNVRERKELNFCRESGAYAFEFVLTNGMIKQGLIDFDNKKVYYGDMIEPTATPTPVATPTAEPTPTEVPEPTGVVEPTATPEPVATATPTAEPTKAPQPTATPKPVPTATPKPKATATPTPKPVANNTTGKFSYEGYAKHWYSDTNIGEAEDVTYTGSYTISEKDNGNGTKTITAVIKLDNYLYDDGAWCKSSGYCFIYDKYTDTAFVDEDYNLKSKVKFGDVELTSTLKYEKAYRSYDTTNYTYTLVVPSDYDGLAYGYAFCLNSDVPNTLWGATCDISALPHRAGYDIAFFN